MLNLGQDLYYLSWHNIICFGIYLTQHKDHNTAMKTSSNYHRTHVIWIHKLQVLKG